MICRLMNRLLQRRNAPIVSISNPIGDSDYVLNADSTKLKTHTRTNIANSSLVSRQLNLGRLVGVSCEESKRYG